MRRVTSTARAAGIAAGAGVVAGLVMALAEVVGATIAGRSPMLPLRMAASVLIGEAALYKATPAQAVGVAILDHLVISAMLGVAYLVFLGRLAERHARSWRAQLLLGVFFGTGVWLFDMVLVPKVGGLHWLLETLPAPQWLAHTLFFGVPLAGLFIAWMPERLALAGSLRWRPAGAS
jgi:hypothetical protein